MSHVPCVNESCHIYAWVMIYTNESGHARMRHVTHMNVSHVTNTNESCHTHQRVLPRT